MSRYIGISWPDTAARARTLGEYSIGCHDSPTMKPYMPGMPDRLVNYPHTATAGMIQEFGSWARDAEALLNSVHVKEYATCPDFSFTATS